MCKSGQSDRDYVVLFCHPTSFHHLFGLLVLHNHHNVFFKLAFLENVLTFLLEAGRYRVIGIHKFTVLQCLRFMMSIKETDLAGTHNL